jgi:hypothetical protein
MPVNFWVDIEDASGNKIGAGPLRPSRFPRSRKLSKSGEFSFDISPSDPNISALSEKRIAVCRYFDKNGQMQEWGGGVIDKIVVNTDGPALTFNVSGNDRLRELTYRSVGSLNLSSGGAGVSDAPDQIMALAPSGWSITGGGSTSESVYVGFDGESVLNALSRAGDHIGEHFRLGSGRVVEWLGEASGFSASGVRAVQHVNDPRQAELASEIAVITNLEEVSDATNIITRIIPRGSGNGSAIATLKHATDTPPTGFTLDIDNNILINDAAEAEYGRIERVVDFKELGPLSNTTADIQAASNMLLQASVQWLRNAVNEKFYRMELWTNPNRLLQVGTTLRVVYRKIIDGKTVLDIDETLNIVEVESELAFDGMSTTAVQVSTTDRLAMSDEDFIVSQIEEARILSAHQQLGASVDTLPWHDMIEDGHPATLPFWVGAEYTSINRALLRFRISPLRSPIKTVAGESTTTESGGGSTSGSGGASTPTSTATPHGHPITIYNGSPGSLVYFSGGLLYSPGGTGQITTRVETPSHTHNVSVPNHTHTTPDHSHTLTPEISVDYGVFDESAGNTLDIDDLVIKLNGGSDLSGDVESLGSGWYELDVTEGLVDSAFRPKQEANEIAFSTSTADKTARIEMQLQIRGVVQAVAYE